ncbi:MAG: translational GTPase TypA [Clostridiales bacterium]|jgi:GTP-binding protein|nr:translational GTPase TypA [Clostridiales bacterium]
MPKRTDVRNVAIIAHVDHGKTTLVDAMLRQSGVFRDNQEVTERVMDSNNIERERGITIFSKNTAVVYEGVKINIIDTPGHADFGGEVERVLKMADCALLLVDSYDGPMPQTRFVLRKALSIGLKPIVVINKIDRPDAMNEQVADKILDLFIELGAPDGLDFSVIYASAKEGYALYNLQDEPVDLTPLFETIIREAPAPEGDFDAPEQVLVTSIESDSYIGRLAIGKVARGTVRAGSQVTVCGGTEQSSYTAKISKLFVFSGLGRVEVESAYCGDIVAVAGISNIGIGETICAFGQPEPLEAVTVDEPTISMLFSVNDSPFAGQDGQFITSRNVRERLFREVETNVSLRVEETDSMDSFRVLGRGELHLSVLIETMRREGYEFQVAKPAVILKKINGVTCEPVEFLNIDVPEEFMGVVMEKLGGRKAELINMTSAHQGYMRLEFLIPSRSLIGYRSEFLTDTKGNGIMSHVFNGFEAFRGEFSLRTRGVLIAAETGEAVAYGLYNAQERGRLFVNPGEPVYEGQIVGENSRGEDITVNVCKKKHITNMRSSASDDSLKLTPVRAMSLEQRLEFIGDDELMEVTPKNIRMRKKILNQEARKRALR